MEVCLIVLSRLSTANSHDRLIEEPDNRGPDKRGCTVAVVEFFIFNHNITIGAGSRVPGGAQAPPELFLAPPEPFEPPLTIEKIMH